MRPVQISTQSSTYRGYSSIGAERTRVWTLTDDDLVKRDLYNHFMTIVGTRAMRPLWGCKIWDYVFENTDGQRIEQQVHDEAVRVVAADPRVTFLSATLISYEHGIRVEVRAKHNRTGTVLSLALSYDREMALQWDSPAGRE